MEFKNEYEFTLNQINNFFFSYQLHIKHNIPPKRLKTIVERVKVALWGKNVKINSSCIQ